MAKRQPQKKVAVAKAPSVKQTDFPLVPLEQALRVPFALVNDFAGEGAAPHDAALAIDVSPTSSAWRTLCGAAMAYGLTEGGYNADQIVLTELGRRIAEPLTEGDDAAARVEALLQPRIMREFFTKYDRAKFPQDAIAANVLVSLGLPRDRTQAAVTTLKEAGKAVGLIRDTNTGLFVALKSAAKATNGNGSGIKPEDHSEPEVHEHAGERETVVAPVTVAHRAQVDGQVNNRVFITHGKSRGIVSQLKELLVFGKLEPVVSVERESTAVPVPDKVFTDMRGCSAGVIHVSNEGEMLDNAGVKHVHINHNVLIEIGAAIALYQKRVILLVEKGVALPSNLTGLYRCEYEGDRLDYEATMKLLKTFNEFK